MSQSATQSASQSASRTARGATVSTTPSKALQTLAARYRAVRAQTEALCAPLEIEDYVVQSMPDASPAKWHLAHTTWFFETLALQPSLDGYEPLDECYAFLFNSYYNSLGEQFTRADRGLVSRPTVAQVRAYRQHVDRAMNALFEGADEATSTGRSTGAASVIEVGLHHEQQHQELLLTDLKHMFSRNPLAPVYRGESAAIERPQDEPAPLRWFAHPEGIYEIGHEGPTAGNRSAERGETSAAGPAFAYDNEGPRHRVYLQGFELASRLVTCGEWLEFMADGGYERPELWLSEGWATVEEHGWRAPLYWLQRADEDDCRDVAPDGWSCFTLSGIRPVRRREPVCHVSFFEADAFARWASLRIPGARLPREAEWEVAAAACDQDAAIADGNFVDDGHFHPRPLAGEPPADRPAQLFGDVWEWTSSPYTSYPGYTPPEGALGEYNAKFMSNQIILRGGSCATPRSHIRSTYRNFFPAHVRWQMMGVRLARDLAARDEAVPSVDGVSGAGRGR